MRRLIFCLGLLAVGLSADEDLPPVPTVSVRTAVVRTAVVPLPEVPLVAVVVPEVTLNRVEIPAAVLADCGITTPASADEPLPLIADCGIATPASNDAPVPLIADCGVATPKSTPPSQSVISDGGRPAAVGLVAVPGHQGNMTAMAEFRKKVSAFRDRRTVVHDLSAVPGSAVYAAWTEIYAGHRDFTAEYVPLPEKLRMIAEVRVPVDRKIFQDNLAYYAARGYNAVLITFDGSENPGMLSAAARQCRQAGLAPWFAFGGREDLRQSVFIAPATLQRLIGELAPLCDGMLLGWRRTSLHLFIPDRAFTDFVLKSARESNPRLCIVGESYLGMTGESGGRFQVTTSIPANASGCLIANIGYEAITPKVLDTVFRGVTVPKIVLVLGQRPYYRTVQANSLSFEENLLIKENIEKRFLSAGAAGTVTLHGDGSDGLRHPAITDNLARGGRE